MTFSRSLSAENLARMSIQVLTPRSKGGGRKSISKTKEVSFNFHGNLGLGTTVQNEQARLKNEKLGMVLNFKAGGKQGIDATRSL